jgi:hypothetical protein
MLRNLDQWLQALRRTRKKGFEVDMLAHSRLAPDQYDLVRQVQSACDAAKYAAAYLSDEAPSHPDTERRLPSGRETQGLRRLPRRSRRPTSPAPGGRVAPAWMEGKSVRGDSYCTRIAVPNFYFHVTTAYAILRHNGVELGKGDFIGVKNWDEIANW